MTIVYKFFEFIHSLIHLKSQERKKEIIPKLANAIIIPAIITPNIIEAMLFFLSKSKIHETRLPVHAPVPGRGIETNKISAKNP